MEYYRFCLMFVFFVSLGTEPCVSETCTADKIYECAQNNLVDDCFFKVPLIACIRKFIDSCQGDLKLEAEEEIKRHTDSINACPGLPDGQCWTQPSWKCTDDLPVFIYHLHRQGQPSLNKTDCSDLISQEAKVKQCLQDFVKLCGTDKAATRAQSFYPYIDNGIKACKENNLSQ